MCEPCFALFLRVLLLTGAFVRSGGDGGFDALLALKPDSFETCETRPRKPCSALKRAPRLAAGVVLLAALVLMLVPGALVRLLYGRRPVSGSAPSAVSIAHPRGFDMEELRRGAHSEV